MPTPDRRLIHLSSMIAAALLGAAACGGNDAPSQEAGRSSTVESFTHETHQTPTDKSAAPGATTKPEPEPSTEASPTPTFDGTVVEVEIGDDEISTPEERVVVPLDSQVRLVITSDIKDEVHVHGVDQYVDLTPGEPVRFDFTASIPGTFEVELHDAGDLLFTLQVQP